MMLYLKLSTIFNFKIKIDALVKPQPGQGILNKLKKRHVLVLIISVNIEYADKQATKKVIFIALGDFKLYYL